MSGIRGCGCSGATGRPLTATASLPQQSLSIRDIFRGADNSTNSVPRPADIFDPDWAMTDVLLVDAAFRMFRSNRPDRMVCKMRKLLVHFMS
jgi:hypothetical protein